MFWRKYFDVLTFLISLTPPVEFYQTKMMQTTIFQPHFANLFSKFSKLHGMLTVYIIESETYIELKQLQVIFI